MKISLSWLPVASGLLVLVLTLVVAVLTVTSTNRQGELATNQNVTTSATEVSPSMSLTLTNGTYAYTPGKTYTQAIVIDSAGKTIDGVDVIINFPADKVSVTNLSATNLLEQDKAQTAHVLISSVDSVKGVIKLSVGTFTPMAVTSGVIGKFDFQPLSKGEVNFQFYFIPGATTDSNMADHTTHKDILGKVTNGRYIFN